MHSAGLIDGNIVTCTPIASLVVQLASPVSRSVCRFRNVLVRSHHCRSRASMLRGSHRLCVACLKFVMLISLLIWFPSLYNSRLCGMSKLEIEQLQAKTLFVCGTDLVVRACVCADNRTWTWRTCSGTVYAE